MSRFRSLAVLPVVLVALACVFAVGHEQPTVTAQGMASEAECSPGSAVDPYTLVPAGTPGCPVHFDHGVSIESAATDERERITSTTEWPWRGIAHLRVVTDLDGVYTCTGYFVAVDIVMTAAHCLYDTEYSADGYATSVEVSPGRDGATRPFGSQTTSDFSVANGYITQGDNEFDWGLVYLPDGTLGNQVGWFTYEAAQQSLVGTTVNLSGYPGDKGGSTQWHEFGSVTEVSPVLFGSLSYDIFTASGQSGAPVWHFDGSLSTVVATHTLGKTSSACLPDYNCGSPITTAVVQSMQNAGVPAPNTTCYSLNVTQNQSLAGVAEIESQPPSSGGCQNTNFGPGTVVTLTASPVSGYSFAGWGGGCNGSSATIQFTMTSDRNCTANYQSDTPATDFVWGDVNCSGGSDPIDSLFVLRFDAGLSVTTPIGCPTPGEVVTVNGGASYAWANIDCSSSADPIDSLKILRKDAGLPVNQPAGCPDIGDEVVLS